MDSRDGVAPLGKTKKHIGLHSKSLWKKLVEQEKTK
jgi:hypothetical protein